MAVTGVNRGRNEIGKDGDDDGVEGLTDWRSTTQITSDGSDLCELGNK